MTGEALRRAVTLCSGLITPAERLQTQPKSPPQSWDLDPPSLAHLSTTMSTIVLHVVFRRWKGRFSIVYVSSVPSALNLGVACSIFLSFPMELFPAVLDIGRPPQVLETLWTFSEFLEAVAMVPQSAGGGVRLRKISEFSILH